MFTRKTIVALAAVASLGAFALATNDASARGFGGGGGMRMGGGGMHVGHIGGGGRIGGVGFRRIGGIGFHRPGFFHRPGIRRWPPIFVHHHHPHWRWGWGWRHRYWYPGYAAVGIGAVGVGTAVATEPTYNRCSCLTKEYTPDGAVLFKDVCTNEAAMNPPATAQQPNAYDPSLDPSAQASVQPQYQPQVQAQPVLPRGGYPQVR